MRSETQKKILNAATKILVDQGITKLSVRSISTSAGISTMGIYHHFNDKQGVLDALRIDGFQILGDAIDNIEDGQSPVDAIINGTKNYIRMALENPAHYTLMFEHIAHGYSPTKTTQNAANMAFSKLINRIADVPELNVSSKVVAIEVWALVHGFVGLKEQVTSELYTQSQWKEMVIDAVIAHLRSRQL